MLTPRGQGKVLNFGLAKRLHPVEPLQVTSAETETQTVPGLIMGTVDYMSPEQVLGQELDQRTDLFSLGVVLYDMAAGRLPFHGTSTTQTMDQILHAEPEGIARFNANIPEQLEQIIRRCLEKKRERRYQAASELCGALRQYQKSLQLSEMGRFDLRSLVRKARKPRIAIPGAIALIAVGCLGFRFFNRQAKIRWARQGLLHKIDQLVEAGWENYVPAYNLAGEAEKYLPHDPGLPRVNLTPAVIS